MKQYISNRTAVTALTVLESLIIAVGANRLFAPANLYVYTGLAVFPLFLTGLIAAWLYGKGKTAGPAAVRWQAAAALLFSLTVDLGALELSLPRAALELLLAAVLVLSGRAARGERKGGRRSCYIRVGWGPAAAGGGVLLTLLSIWVVDWQPHMDDFIRPAGSGASLIKYVNGEKLTVRVEGGFIYSHSLRGQPGGAVHELYNRQGNKAVETKGESSAAAPGPSAALELAVKLLGPDAKITVDSAAELRTTVRLMNIDPTAAAVRLDGRLLRPRPDPAVRAASDRGTWVPPNPRGTSFITDTRGYRLSFQAGDGLRRTLSVDSIEGGGREFRFAVASDTHSGFTTSLPALRAITEHGCDFMFMNGDFTNNGYPIEYTLNAAFFESMPLPVYTSVGNHDRWDGAQSAEHYAAYFGPDYYSFDYGNTRFIVLDTSMGTTGMEQIEWLEAVLQRNDRRHTVIVSHIPPVDTVKGGFDDSAVLHPELRHSVYSSTESNRLMELFRRHAVDYWVAGHNHVYGEFRTAGGTVVTGGVMGGSRVEGDTPGYLLFRVHGEEIGHDFVPITTFADEHPLPGAKAVESASVFLSPILINHSFRIVLTYLLGFVLLFFLPVWKRRWIKWERDGGKPA